MKVYITYPNALKCLVSSAIHGKIQNLNTKDGETFWNLIHSCNTWAVAALHLFEQNTPEARKELEEYLNNKIAQTAFPRIFNVRADTSDKLNTTLFQLNNICIAAIHMYSNHIGLKGQINLVYDKKNMIAWGDVWHLMEY